MSPRPIRPQLEALDGRLLLSGLPALSVGFATVVEGNDGTSFAEVVVSLSKPNKKSVTVSYGTADETARAGSDYTAASGKLSFARGQTTQTIRIALSGDRLVEPDESFVVRLSGAQNATIAPGYGVVTIVDDEPRITIDSYVEVTDDDWASGAEITFNVRLWTGYDQPVTVNYATADGTGVAGVDYVTTFGTLTFAPGETDKTITVELLGATAPAPGTDFVVNLSGASADALVLWGQGVGSYFPPGYGATPYDSSGYYWW